MGYILYLLGLLTMAAGALWTAGAFATGGGVTDGISLLSKLVVAGPGLGTMFAGLLLVAAGGVLMTLSDIRRYARQAARTLQTIEERSRAE